MNSSTKSSCDSNFGDNSSSAVIKPDPDGSIMPTTPGDSTAKNRDTRVPKSVNVTETTASPAVITSSLPSTTTGKLPVGKESAKSVMTSPAATRQKFVGIEKQARTKSGIRKLLQKKMAERDDSVGTEKPAKTLSGIRKLQQIKMAKWDDILHRSPSAQSPKVAAEMATTASSVSGSSKEVSVL